MIASLLADAVLVLHLAFVAFVAAGALLLWRWPRLVWVHLPALAWGAYVELSGAICPLTPLENRLHALAGAQVYAGDFIGHYVSVLLYPQGLTRGAQLLMGMGVLALNVTLYALWQRRSRRR